MKIKRYDVIIGENSWGKIVKRIEKYDGKYVKYDDIKHILNLKNADGEIPESYPKLCAVCAVLNNSKELLLADVADVIYHGNIIKNRLNQETIATCKDMLTARWIVNLIRLANGI